MEPRRIAANDGEIFTLPGDQTVRLLARYAASERLWIGLPSMEVVPYLARVIAAERADVQQGDVPMFTGRPATCHIESSSGATIPDFFEAAPHE